MFLFALKGLIQYIKEILCTVHVSDEKIIKDYQDLFFDNYFTDFTSLFFVSFQLKCI